MTDVTEAQVCDCASCVETRALRAVHPELKPTMQEQLHAFSIALRQFIGALATTLGITRLAGWLNRRLS